MTRPTPRTVLTSAALAAALLGAPAWAQQAQTPAQETQAPAQPAQPASEPAVEAPAADPQARGQAQQPRQVVTQTFEAWNIVCLNGEPPCVMRQAGETAEGQEIMEVSIRRIEPQQTQQGTVEAVMDVRVPLGVLLREGLSVQVDDSEAQRGAYTICVVDGCLMREPLPNAILNQLKKGAKAQFSFVAPQASGATRMAADLSLNGFTAAYNALQP